MRRIVLIAIVLSFGAAGLVQSQERQGGSLRAKLIDPAIQEGLRGQVADGSFWSLSAGVYLSAAGDYVTTRRFRDQGIEEANPIFAPLADSPAGLAAVKLGGGTLINYIAYNLKKDGKRYWSAPQIAWIALNIAVSLHNNNAAN